MHRRFSRRISALATTLATVAALAIFAPIDLRGDDSTLTELIAVIRSVGNEARNNDAASTAFRQLAQSDAAAIPVILAAMDDASPFAANWLRSAVESITQRTLESSKTLPADKLEAFVLDTRHDPRGRRLAFDLLAQVDNTATTRLIPGMLNDPSVELRRDAVQQRIDAANSLFDADKKDEAKTIYLQAMSGARDDDQVKALVKRLGELGEKVDLQKHFGFITAWQLIGPFDNHDKKGFGVAYPPEGEVNLSAKYPGKTGEPISWLPATTDNEYGILDLNKVQAHHKGAVTYATAEFYSSREQKVEFRLGTPNAWKVWLNGAFVFGRDEYHRGSRLDQYRMPVTLKPGRNVILIKLCQNEQTEDWAQKWEFQLRVCDIAGTAITSAPRPEAASIVPAPRAADSLTAVRIAGAAR